MFRPILSDIAIASRSPAPWLLRSAAYLPSVCAKTFWLDHYADSLIGKKIVKLYDYDAPGMRAFTEIIPSIQAAFKRAADKRAADDLPELEQAVFAVNIARTENYDVANAWDASDFLARHGDSAASDLVRLINHEVSAEGWLRMPAEAAESTAVTPAPPAAAPEVTTAGTDQTLETAAATATAAADPAVVPAPEALVAAPTPAPPADPDTPDTLDVAVLEKMWRDAPDKAKRAEYKARFYKARAAQQTTPIKRL